MTTGAKPGARTLLLAAVVTTLLGGVDAHAFRPSSKWLVDQAVTKQIERALRNMKVEQETQLYDAGGAMRGGPFGERIFFQSPASVRRESDAPDGARVELRVDDRVTMKQAGAPVPAGAKPTVDVVADFFTIGGAVNPDQGSERLQRDLKTLGANPEIVSLVRWDGRIAYLIGSKPWETDKPQVWLDKDTLLVVGVVSIARDAGCAVRSDVRLLGYGSYEGGNWFPKSIETWIDDKLTRRSTTRTVDKNVPMDATLFDPRR